MKFDVSSGEAQGPSHHDNQYGSHISNSGPSLSSDDPELSALVSHPNYLPNPDFAFRHPEDDDMNLNVFYPGMANTNNAHCQTHSYQTNSYLG